MVFHLVRGWRAHHVLDLVLRRVRPRFGTILCVAVFRIRDSILHRKGGPTARTNLDRPASERIEYRC